MSNTGDLLNIGVSKLPTIAVKYEYGTIPGTYAANELVNRSGTDAAAKYTKTVSFKLEEGYRLSDSPISFQVDANEALNAGDLAKVLAKITRTQIWQRGDEYVLTVTLDETVSTNVPGFTFDGTTVSVIVNASKDHTVTLDLPKDAAGNEIVQPDKFEKRSKSVKDGDTVKFNLVGTAGWEIVDTEQYTAKRTSAANADPITYEVTVTDPIHSDTTVQIVAREELGLNYQAFKGTSAFKNKLTATFDTTGDSFKRSEERRVGKECRL